MAAWPAHFQRWVYSEGRPASGRYTIEWVPWKDLGRAIVLSHRGEALEMFPDDVGNIFAAMEAAYEHAAEEARA